MKNDTTDKKVDNNLSDSELMKVTGGDASCLDYKNQAECESYTECSWNSKFSSCSYEDLPAFT